MTKLFENDNATDQIPFADFAVHQQKLEIRNASATLPVCQRVLAHIKNLRQLSSGNAIVHVETTVFAIGPKTIIAFRFQAPAHVATKI